MARDKNEKKELNNQKDKNKPKAVHFYGLDAVLFLLLTVSLVALLFLGMGTDYLLKEGVLGLSEEKYEEFKETSGLTYMEMLERETQKSQEESEKKIDVKIFVDMGKLLSENPSSNALTHDMALQVSSYIIHMHEGESFNTSIKEFADRFGIKYSVFLYTGRRMYGNLPTNKEDYAWKCRCLFYDAATHYYTERYVVKLWAEDQGALKYLTTVQYQLMTICMKYREFVVCGMVISLICSLLFLSILMIMVVKLGRRKQSLLARVPWEAVLLAGGLVAYLGWTRFLSGLHTISSQVYMMDTLEQGIREDLNLLLLPVLAFIIASLFLILHSIRRWQDKKWYVHTFFHAMLQACIRILLEWKKMLLDLSMTWKFFLALMGLSVGEGIVIFLLFRKDIYVYVALGLLLLEKAILIPLIMKYISSFSKFEKATEEIAGGNLQYRLDTKEIPRLFRKMGEELNDMAGSISKAVEQKLQSERLKTELITNVSHDIKTPLTSIINFSDLICREKTDNEKITEYAEHLHHQSSRLKKLIEDLMEASKASTGNLEVNLEPCDVKVLLGQCLGEFEPRLMEQQLELIVQQSEQEFRIMADQRLLWRVFENLMNNICKYAQKETRVYLSADRVEDKVRITFKNISRYALNIPPEELMERFVRGDLSRHTEGSGLGLSIVNSLMELQGGKLTLVTDGDLFKAILEFPIFSAKNEVVSE